MKKVNMSKLLEVLQKVDNKIYIDHGVVIHKMEGYLFYLVNEDQEQEFIDHMENPKDCFDFNKRVLYAYLRQLKDEFIYEIPCDVDKVKSNLEKLGLSGSIEGEDYCVKSVGIIRKKNFIYIEHLESIPQGEIRLTGERVYNNILKASKEWGKWT